jgi:hypothetical protein
MLNKILLQNKLLKFFSDNKKSAKDAAEQLSTIIDDYIKSATVTVNGNGVTPPGGVVTVGSPATQVNSIPVMSTVTGNGKIT